MVNTIKKMRGHHLASIACGYLNNGVFGQYVDSLFAGEVVLTDSLVDELCMVCDQPDKSGCDPKFSELDRKVISMFGLEMEKPYAFETLKAKITEMMASEPAIKDFVYDLQKGAS